jgi:hypothetical protein
MKLKKALANAVDAGGPPAELYDEMEQPVVTEVPDGGSVEQAETADGGAAPATLVAEVEQSLETGALQGNGTADSASDGGPCPGSLIGDVEDRYNNDTADE